jgi:hypothetical protein
MIGIVAMGRAALCEEGDMDTSMEACHEEREMDEQWRSNSMRKVRLLTQFTNEPC